MSDDSPEAFAVGDELHIEYKTPELYPNAMAATVVETVAMPDHKRADFRVYVESDGVEWRFRVNSDDELGDVGVKIQRHYDQYGWGGVSGHIDDIKRASDLDAADDDVAGLIGATHGTGGVQR